MAKKTASKKVEKKIREYIDILRHDNLPIKKVILFGSYVKGTQHKWSDIDLCIVSPRFKNSFDAMQYLWLKRASDKGLTIEPVGFSPQDFRDKYNSLIAEIRNTGVEISF